MCAGRSQDQTWQVSVFFLSVKCHWAFFFLYSHSFNAPVSMYLLLGIRYLGCNYSRKNINVLSSVKHFKPHPSHAQCPETRKMLDFDSHLKYGHFEVFPYVCMWKPCVYNVSRPLYVSVRYLENSSLHSTALAILYSF